MGIFSFLFGKKKLSLEDADKRNDKFIKKNPTPANQENEDMRNASKALTSGRFDDAIQLYTVMSEKYTEKKGLYLSQVGASYFFLGNYDKAIELYMDGKDAGADEGMMDDNVWEACLEIHKQENNNEPIERYLKYFPNGGYVKKANKILSK